MLLRLSLSGHTAAATADACRDAGAAHWHMHYVCYSSVSGQCGHAKSIGFGLHQYLGHRARQGPVVMVFAAVSAKVATAIFGFTFVSQCVPGSKRRGIKACPPDASGTMMVSGVAGSCSGAARVAEVVGGAGGVVMVTPRLISNFFFSNSLIPCSSPNFIFSIASFFSASCFFKFSNSFCFLLIFSCFSFSSFSFFFLSSTSFACFAAFSFSFSFCFSFSACSFSCCNLALFLSLFFCPRLCSVLFLCLPLLASFSPVSFFLTYFLSVVCSSVALPLQVSPVLLVVAEQ